MKHLAIFFAVFALSIATFGCGGDDESMSCRSAMAHFYSQGCEFNVGMPLSEPEAVGLCDGARDDANALGGSCPGAFDAYLACLATIAEQVCNGCDAELTALDPCLQ